MNVRSAAFLALFCLLLSGVQTATAFAGPVTFPTYGITFTPPAQTTPSPLIESVGTIATYRFDEGSEFEGAAICVEWIAAKGATQDDLVLRLKNQFGGTIDPGEFKIGDHKAARISSSYNRDMYSSRVTYVCVQDQMGYMVSAFNSHAADVSKQLETFVSTFTFFKPHSPLAHIDELTDQPLTYFGTIRVKAPRSARLFVAKPDEINFGIHDLSGDAIHQPFSVDIRPIRFVDSVDFDDLRDTYSSNMAKLLNVPDNQLKWSKMDGSPHLFVTAPIRNVVETPGAKPIHQVTRIGMLELSQGSLIQFIFSIEDEPAGKNDGYLKSTDLMLASVRTIRATKK